MTSRVVLHVDADAFFCQVETLKDPRLQGKAIAVQQHQDIIAANHAAKQAGVTKHMSPREARALLSKVGGEVVHVHCEEDEGEVMGNGHTRAPAPRVSYRPYRETSAAMIKLLKGAPGVGVVERASIDEAYLTLSSHEGASGAVGCGNSAALQAGVRLGEHIRARVRQGLGIVVSVGVASNKLLSKLASQAAKPNGLRCIDTPAAAAALLEHTPITKLPGMGGKVAATLLSSGITEAGQVAALISGQGQGPGQTGLSGAGHRALVELGVPAAAATTLAAYVMGRDGREVVDKGPPKSFQVQMTLTPIALPAGAVGPRAPLPGAPHPQPQGALRPLPCGGPDTRQRLGQVLRPMCRDMVSRLLLDRHEHGRWAKKLVVTLATMHPPSPSPPPGESEPPTSLPPMIGHRPGPVLSKSLSSSCPFPVPNGITMPLAGGGDGSSGGAVEGGGGGGGGGGGLPAASSRGVAAAAAVVPKGGDAGLVMGERMFDVAPLAAAAVMATPAAAQGMAGAFKEGGGGCVQGPGSAQVPARHEAGGGTGPQAALLASVVRAAEGLAAGIAARCPPTHVVTQVAVAATNMAPWHPGSGSTPGIAQFITNPANAAAAHAAPATHAAPAAPAIAKEVTVQVVEERDQGHVGCSDTVGGGAPEAPTLNNPPQLVAPLVPSKRGREEAGIAEHSLPPRPAPRQMAPPSMQCHASGGIMPLSGGRGEQTTSRAVHPPPGSALDMPMPPPAASDGAQLMPKAIRLTEALELLAHLPDISEVEEDGGDVVADNAEAWLRGRLQASLGQQLASQALLLLGGRVHNP